MLDLAFKNKHLIIVLALLTAVISLVAVGRPPVDILPNYNTSAVQVLTLYPGMPAEVEDFNNIVIKCGFGRRTGRAQRYDHPEIKVEIELDNPQSVDSIALPGTEQDLSLREAIKADGAGRPSRASRLRRGP